MEIRSNILKIKKQTTPEIFLKWIWSGFFFFSSSFCFADQTALCPTVVIDSDRKIKLSDVEKRLVCGDPEQKNGLPWANIPPNQAQFHMRSLLQARGFLNPQFEVREDVLWVKPGGLVLMTKITLDHSPLKIDFSKERGFINKPLTPLQLNVIENRVNFRLRQSGYPCPFVKATADQKSGEVFVHVQSGPHQRIGSVDVNDNLGLRGGVLRRYDAFSVGDEFDQENLILTERRILADNILNTTHFAAECGDDGSTHIHQHVNGGAPRTLRFGLGVDTEQLVMGRISWHHSRVDENASIFGVSAQAGYVTQSFNADLKEFSFTDPRQYLRPRLSVSHDKEVSQETNSIVTGVPWGKTWDTPHAGWLTELGPVVRYDNTVTGVTKGSTHSLLVSGEFVLTSHDFEFYSTSPRTGYRLSLSGDLSNEQVISSATAQRLGVLMEFLWNFNEYEPPVVVFGLRTGASFTFTSDSVSDPNLAVNFKNYLGGSTDLRGFNRQELPSNGFGALAAVYASFESRFTSLLPFSIQPFLFMDLGELGYQVASLDSTLYYSPGFGLRWDSPVGVFRSTLAHGHVNSPDGIDQSNSHWQFYLSYGEEF